MKLLLDTCTFLWILTDAAELSATSREAFTDPENEVFLSAVSAWEIALKHSLGKLSLPDDPAAYIPRQRERHFIRALPLEEGSILHLSRLPRLHRDPFDRALVCQAIAAGMTIATPDGDIRRYPVPTLW